METNSQTDSCLNKRIIKQKNPKKAYVYIILTNCVLSKMIRFYLRSSLTIKKIILVNTLSENI